MKKNIFIIMFLLIVDIAAAQYPSAGLSIGYGKTHYDLNDRTEAGYLPLNLNLYYHFNDWVVLGLDYRYNLLQPTFIDYNNTNTIYYSETFNDMYVGTKLIIPVFGFNPYDRFYSICLIAGGGAYFNNNMVSNYRDSGNTIRYLYKTTFGYNGGLSFWYAIDDYWTLSIDSRYYWVNKNSVDLLLQDNLKSLNTNHWDINIGISRNLIDGFGGRKSGIPTNF